MTQNTCPDCRGTRFYIGLLDREPCRTCCGEEAEPKNVTNVLPAPAPAPLKHGWFKLRTGETQLHWNGELLVTIRRLKSRRQWGVTSHKSNRTSIHDSKIEAKRWAQEELGLKSLSFKPCKRPASSPPSFVFRDYAIHVRKLEEGKWEWRFKNQREICNNPKTADDMASGALHNEIVSSFSGRACDPFVNCTIVSVAYQNVTLFVTDSKYISEVADIVQELVPPSWSVNVVNPSAQQRGEIDQ